MNIILENKLKELENAGDYECWYLVKQPTTFDSLCYLVSFLEEFKSKDVSGNLQDFIGVKVNELKKNKPNVEISNNYRALRVAAFFGLITMTSSKYDEAIITETFQEITSKCNGEYENIDSYIDVVQRQIEKMFISSQIDEAYNGIRQEYRLYPVMLLYKILIEMGRSTGKYQISMTEYRYLVATTKTFEGFLETLLLIKLLRDDNSALNDFEQYRTKFDNRLIQALKQLPTLVIDRDSILITDSAIDEVAKKVFVFEANPNIFATEKYLGFLGSTKSLFELDDFESEEGTDMDLDDNIDLESERIKNGKNVLLYGVPGSGKSHEIDKIVVDAEFQERIVFHPDYTYSDFVGQIMPKLKQVEDIGEIKLTYEFVPGPFTSILKKAINNEDEMHYLIIEEINRGNAPAIFGDIFQLLDRDENGSSKYYITNADIAKEIYGDETQRVAIPSNLTIYATMNTSDQNVFTLDTAFQRRWIMKYVDNDVLNAEHANVNIEGSSVTWGSFASVINEEVLEYNEGLASSEDKQLGAYFVKIDELSADKFPEKALKYLWDDAFKLERYKVFSDEIKSMSDVVKTYRTEIMNHHDPINKIMRAEVYERMIGGRVSDDPSDPDGMNEAFSTIDAAE